MEIYVLRGVTTSKPIPKNPAKIRLSNGTTYVLVHFLVVERPVTGYILCLCHTACAVERTRCRGSCAPATTVTVTRHWPLANPIDQSIARTLHDVLPARHMTCLDRAGGSRWVWLRVWKPYPICSQPTLPL